MQAEIFSPAVKEIFRLRRSEIACCRKQLYLGTGFSERNRQSGNHLLFLYNSFRHAVACHLPRGWRLKNDYSSHFLSAKRNISCRQANISPPSGGISLVVRQISLAVRQISLRPSGELFSPRSGIPFVVSWILMPAGRVINRLGGEENGAEGNKSSATGAK